MWGEMIIQTAKMWDSMYYHVQTEANCFIIIMILFGLMYSMKPRKTPYYVYLPTGIFCASLIAFMDIAIAVMAQNMKDDGAWIVTLAMMVSTFLYYVCLTNICLYVVSFLPNRRMNIRRLEIIGRLVMWAGIIPAWIMIFIHGGQRNEHGVISIKYYIEAVTDASLVVVAFVLVFLLKHRHEIARIVYRGVMSFLPFDVLFLIIQHYQHRTLFVSMMAMLPLFGLYIFFHSNPFDEILGCQNTYAMEIQFNQNVKDKKPFYFGMLRIPSLLHKSFLADESNDVISLIEIIRQMETQHKDMHIFRRSAGEFYLIYETENTIDARKDMHDIGHMLTDKLDGIFIDEKIVMIGIEYNDKIRNINMMMDIVQQAVHKYSDQFGSCRILLKNNSYSELIEAYYLAELLEDLRDERKYDNENVVCYAQPIYEVSSKQFFTAEALMRLSVNGDMISPNVFVPIAEANNCIHFLTICMFHKVCTAIKQLMKEVQFDAISINVSVQEFGEPDAADEFLDIIRSYEVPMDKIRIELTESALAIDNDMLAANMQKMADNGIKFYLDDFGTGYSSLERLTELPFSVVKFDKSLLYSALKNKKTDRLINGIVPIIKIDNLSALVEGVENDDQYEYSVGTGFEYVQGYKWAKPVPIMELKGYFNKITEEDAE